MTNERLNIKDAVKILDALIREQHGRDFYVAEHLKQVKNMLRATVDRLLQMEQEIDDILQVVESPLSVGSDVRLYED